MSKVVALKVQQKDNSKREALRTLVAAHGQFEADYTAVSNGLMKAQQQRSMAFAAIEAANEAFDKVKIANSKYLAEVACGRSPPAPISLRAARGEITDAEDAYAAAKEAEVSLQATVNDMQSARRDYRSLRVKVEAAAQEVLKDEVDPAAFIADIRRLQGTLIEKRLVLRWLTAKGLATGEDNPDAEWRLPSTCMPYQACPPEWQGGSASRGWDEAHSNLLVDADAVLPKLS